MTFIHLGSDAGEATPTKFDDGLLAASEVVQLKLDADWVVLSACNTIAGAMPGAEAEAEALSGWRGHSSSPVRERCCRRSGDLLR